ncbi:hypothetical protein [Pseudonocardia sp. NPDC049154]|uniref:hypothetical protein n=1 Tax=Pseudonocardia sp. NPDC049154 TaxID=3155501 RepID=UPI0033C14734
MALRTWLERQLEVPDGNGHDPIERPDFDRKDDPELFDAVTAYIEQRAKFNPLAQKLRRLMEDRGWEPI